MLKNLKYTPENHECHWISKFSEFDDNQYVLQRLSSILLRTFKDIDVSLINDLIVFFEDDSNKYSSKDQHLKIHYFNNIWQAMVHNYLNRHFVKIEQGKLIFSKDVIYRNTAYFMNKSLIVDAFRTKFPDYNGKNSSDFQKASSWLVEQALKYVLDKGYSFILDATFAILSAETNIIRAEKSGFRVTIFYVYQEPQIAWQFTKEREVAERAQSSKENLY